MLNLSHWLPSAMTMQSNDTIFTLKCSYLRVKSKWRSYWKSSHQQQVATSKQTQVLSSCHLTLDHQKNTCWCHAFAERVQTESTAFLKAIIIICESPIMTQIKPKHTQQPLHWKKTKPKNEKKTYLEMPLTGSMQKKTEYYWNILYRDKHLPRIQKQN